MSGKSNHALIKSKASVDNDEYYTQYMDVEKELSHYIAQFKGMRVYCNCDNPVQSQFVRFFLKNYRTFGMRRLIATSLNHPNGRCMDICDPPDFQSEQDVCDYIRENQSSLSGDGSFQSEECQRIMDDCDIVVTNPPFSLFRLWYETVKAHSKRYVVLGSMNTCVTKSIIKDIVDGRCRFGYDVNRHYYFKSPTGKTKDIGYTCWLTNLTVEPKPFIPLTDTRIEEYRRYDGQDVLRVQSVLNIPRYEGIMGVPITFLFRHNPDQFRIVGIANSGNFDGVDLFKPKIDGKPQYKVILIKAVGQ